PSGNEYAEVLAILNRYYHNLVAKLAEEVLEKRDDFDYPLLSNAEGVIEKYAHLINHCNTIYRALKSQGQALFQGKLVWLKEDEYLCFSCRAVMQKNATSCLKCGWSWERETG